MSAPILGGWVKNNLEKHLKSIRLQCRIPVTPSANVGHKSLCTVFTFVSLQVPKKKKRKTVAALKMAEE